MPLSNDPSDILCVHHTGGGKFFLLHWWTYNERGHLVLAPTRESLFTTARRIFEEHSDAEIKAYCSIEIVGPSAKLCTHFGRHSRQERVNLFHSEIVGRVLELVKADMPLPPQFRLCDKYERDDEEDSEEEFSKKTHYSCHHCRETIQLVGLTPESLYEKFFKAWQEKDNDHWKSHVDPKRFPSRAVVAEDNEPLWYAEAAFGHHSGGVELKEIDMEEVESSYRPSCLSDRTMFFFRRGQDIDPVALKAVLDEFKSKHKARQKQQEQDRKKEFKQTEQKRRLTTVAFFKQFGVFDG